MNESKFTELVNSYFDREIAVDELEHLRRELAKNSKRRREFEIRYRLHKATCSALSSEDLHLPQDSESTTLKVNQTNNISVWLLGLGIAACIALTFVFSASIFRESSLELQLFDKTPLNKSDIDRYVESRSVRERARGSLASQLRLMGLTPDLVPPRPSLSAVDVEFLQQLETRKQQAIERVNQYRTYSAFSKLQLNESLQYSGSATGDQHLPAGFQNSLASY